MLIEVLKSKIHRVKVTEAHLDYIGSIAIDKTLMNAANIIMGEKVQILNITNGERLETYVIEGKENSGEITVNGPAAHKVKAHDLIIIVSYTQLDFKKAKLFKPKIIFPNPKTNKLT
tara:strand:- start:516 stop:866 length:351 start_codon:yes stop_codon:yes gene_type:complete